jgi:hypothetical protein
MIDPKPKTKVSPFMMFLIYCKDKCFVLSSQMLWRTFWKNRGKMREKWARRGGGGGGGAYFVVFSEMEKPSKKEWEKEKAPCGECSERPPCPC